MPGRNREAWNDEDYATLRRMAAAGDDLLTIAQALERTQEAVARKASRLRITIKPSG